MPNSASSLALHVLWVERAAHLWRNARKEVEMKLMKRTVRKMGVPPDRLLRSKQATEMEDF